MSSSATGTVILTGANGGLGTAIVKQLASDSKFSTYYNIYTVRDATKSQEITSEVPHEFVSLDLTDLTNVRQVAEVINARINAGEIPPIRALILNAGFQDFGKQTWTSQGLDTTFAANYLGHWLLTLLLLGSMSKVDGRVIYVGSEAHDPTDPKNTSRGFDNPKYKTIISNADSFHAIAKGTWSPATEDAGFRGGYRRYGASKCFQVMMQHELQARLDADPELSRLCVVGVDPGYMATGLQRLAPWVIRVLLFQVVFPLISYLLPKKAPLRPTSLPASEVLEAAFAAGEGPGSLKDKYFFEQKPKETGEESRDMAKRALVWKETVKLAGLKENETSIAQWQ
ncbi:NAD(P)-binding protein [Apiospora sp. TS-2023a]